jgi:hypothetical protein
MVMMKKFITLSIFIGSFAMATATNHSMLSENSEKRTLSNEAIQRGPKPPREVFEKMLIACRGRSEGSCKVDVVDPDGNALTLEASCQIDEDLNRPICAIPPPPRP